MPANNYLRSSGGGGTGATGATGPAGPAGATGATGATGASGAVTLTTAVVDFGATQTDTVATVITDALVNTASKILLSPYFTTALALGRDVEEIMIDPISTVVVPGTGNFTIYAAAIFGTVSGKYGFIYTVGA